MSINEIRIGQYRFSKNLGNGTFGKVRMAFHEQTGHKVAIKILNKKKIRQFGVFEKVKRELKILRRFNNPHTIKLFEFIDTQTEIFMVLEYAAGGELFDLIARREKLSEDDARKIFQQIISSLEYSHQDKIAHRDLKPENLLLDDQNNIRLIDFGLANIMRDSLALKTACGSPNYAAPEVISGMSYGGAEVDIWSCGVILYAMVCGSLPFDDDHMPQLFNKIKECRYYIPGNLSPAMQDLINRMLQPNPVKRISLQEIQEHVWYVKDLPDYLHFISKQQINNKNAIVDKKIVHQLFNLNLSITKSFEEVCQDILNKRNTDYCGAYELIKHDKLKKEYFQSGNNNKKMNNYMMAASGGTPRQSENSDTDKKYKKKGTLKSISQILSSMNQARRVDSMVMLSETTAQNTASRSKKNRVVMSSSHLKRLNRINQKFKRCNDQNVDLQSPAYQSMSLATPTTAGGGLSGQDMNYAGSANKVFQRKCWLNLPKYAPLQKHIYVKNPFSCDSRTNQSYLNMQVQQQGSFHVGMKFLGDPHEMLKLVCRALVQVEIEWQYDAKEMKLKCRTKVDDEKLVDDDKFIEDFIRQQFLKFYVYINKLVKSNNQPQQKRRGPPAAQNLDSSGNTIKSASSQTKSVGEHHILNLYLQKGTIPVFLELADNFFQIIQSEIASGSCQSITCQPATATSQQPARIGQ